MALPRCTLKSFMFVCPRVFYLLKNNSFSAQISFELFLNFHFREILSFCHTPFRYLQLKFFLHRFETISRKLFGISPWILIELIFCFCRFYPTVCFCCVEISSAVSTFTAPHLVTRWALSNSLYLFNKPGWSQVVKYWGGGRTVKINDPLS